jgi:fructokinase
VDARADTDAPLVAGVELGGTKCVCTLGTGPGDLRAEFRIPTDVPAVTLAAIGAVLDEWRRRSGGIAALGIASFGPLDLRDGSPTHGFITATPKPGWSQTDVCGRLGAYVPGVPVAIATDVTGAALAEGRYGAARGLTDFAYVTVGTGVGVGVISAGKPLQGIHHPELGHARVARLPGDTWPGSCPFHGDCVEGLASGPAIARRAGMPGEAVPAGSPLWHGVAHALAQLLHQIVLGLAPQRILMGGGVLQSRPELLGAVRTMLATSLAGYLVLDELGAGLDDYIVAPGLGAAAGPVGALTVAHRALAGTALKTRGQSSPKSPT